MPLPATIPLPGGLGLPAVGLGTFKARGADVAGAVAAALEEGYRHIDTASIYKNEADIAAAIAASGVPRRQLFITSKVSPYQQGTEAATAACEASLAALRACSTGCGGGSDGRNGGRNSGDGAASSAAIDLMLIHWPGVAKQAADSPLNEELRRQTWRVLESYHRRGALRAVGVSNYEVAHLEELLTYAEVAPAVNQVECHPRFQQRALRAFCARHGIAVVAYASYGCGQLLSDPAVLAAAAAARVTPAQALLLWGLHRGCAVIPKSVRRERLAEVAPARLAELDRQLSPAALAALLAALDALGGEEEGNGDGQGGGGAGQQQEVKYCWDPRGIR